MPVSTELFRPVQQFFQDYLCTQRGVSQNTIKAYRDALKLYLNFVADHVGRKVARLTPDELTAEVTIAFLKDIEKTRKNTAVTRNLRLAALRTFFSFLSSQDPQHVGEYQRILQIPLKKTARVTFNYLEPTEVKSILAAIDRSTEIGERDYVLLSVLYNTGARVQELCDLQVEAAHLETPAFLSITGKGRKTRQVPLWDDVADVLRRFIQNNNIHLNPKAYVFRNSTGSVLGRFGVRYIIQKRVREAADQCASLKKKRVSPHTFRHSTALHLLQAGIDLTIIRCWLGHVNISTTHAYIESDLEMKRKALNATKALKTSGQLKQVLARNKDVISWLDSL